MDIWNYNPDTGEIVSKSVADASPLEDGVFLIPAYATTIAPPEHQPGKSAIFSDGAWSVVDDYRGETWWRAHNDPVIIASLGDPSVSGLSRNEPPAPPQPPPEPTPPEPEPEPLIPQQAPMWAVRVVLYRHNLLTPAQDAITASNDYALQTIWEYGNFADRGSNAIAALSAALNLTSDQVDQFFIEANTIAI